MRRHYLGIMLASVTRLAGCATSQPYTQPAPMPSDIGWTAPRVEPSPEPTPAHPRPASPFEQVLTCEDGIPVKVAVGVTSRLALQFDPGVYVPEVKGAYEDWQPTGEDDQQPWKAVIGKPGGVRDGLSHGQPSWDDHRLDDPHQLWPLLDRCA